MFSHFPATLHLGKAATKLYVETHREKRQNILVCKSPGKRNYSPTQRVCESPCVYLTSALCVDVTTAQKQNA